MLKINSVFSLFLLFGLIQTSSLVSQEKINDYKLFEPINNIDFNEKNNRSLYKNINSINSNFFDSELNLRSDFSFKLDSIINWELVNLMPTAVTKLDFFFDEVNNKYISARSIKSNNTNAWIPRSFNVLSFNKKNLLEKLTFNNWDGSTQNWDDSNPEFTHSYKYNENDLLENYKVQDQQSLQLGRPLNQITYQYDENNLLESISRFSWSNEQNTLIFNTEITYRHDSNQNLEEIIEFKVDDNDNWMLTDSVYLRYNINNLLVEETFYAPLSGMIRLTNYSKNIYRYNSDNSLDELVYYNRFDENIKDWKDKEVTVYSYYNFGSLNRAITYDSIPELYDREKIYESKYNHNNMIASDIVLYPFLPNGRRTSSRQHFEKYVLLNQTHMFTDPFSSPLLDFKNEYFYSNISTSNVNLLEDRNLKVFPNPCEDFIQFENSEDNRNLEIRLFDVKGQVLKKESITSGEIINVSKLNSGLFFYQILEGKNLHTGRVIKI